MTKDEFQSQALALAGRLDATSDAEFVQWQRLGPQGVVLLPKPIYNDIAGEWVEFLTPFGLGKPGDAYEAVARRGWDNAGLVGAASWDEVMHIASSLARAQNTLGLDTLQQAHARGMLSGVLRRLADLADTPDGAQRLGTKSQTIFSANDTPSSS